MARTIPKAVRELCLAFPEAEEFESHGSPDTRAKKGKVFAMFAVNHHGDGHVALWLNTPALEQSRLLASSRHLYKPPYVGPHGCRGSHRVESRGLLEIRGGTRAHGLREQLPREAGGARRQTTGGGRAHREDEARRDRPHVGAARAEAAGAHAQDGLALPETAEGEGFGSLQRVGKKGFALLYDYGKGLTASFWVGIDARPVGAGPALLRALVPGALRLDRVDVSKGVDADELRSFVIESYRNFATRRALAKMAD